MNLAVLGLGFLLSWIAISGAWVLLPLTIPGWLLTVSAMRVFQTSFGHHASHQRFLNPPWLGKLIAGGTSTSIWIQPLSRYQPDHALHHGKIATTDDADLRFLVELGFKPGLTVRQYRRFFVVQLFSPMFHAQYARYRLLANFVTAPWPLYQMAGLFQLVSEHNLVRMGDGVDRPHVVLGRLTHARFFGESVPDTSAGLLAWLG